MSSDDSTAPDTPVSKILKNLRNLPGELSSGMPILMDIADISLNTVFAPRFTETGTADLLDSPGGRGPHRGLLRKRLDRRYARICVVHSELNKLHLRNAEPGVNFEDFVFRQTDFDIYKRISVKNFERFFVAGLDDYGESFYKKHLLMSRKNVMALIRDSYYLEAGSYFCKTVNGEINPLLLGIVRTLHTSLEFLPLIGREELREECTALINSLQSCSAIDREAAANLNVGFPALSNGLLWALDGAVVTHSDTMMTTLSVKEENGKPALYGTFRPQNKNFTIVLAHWDKHML
jgi:hypothetical protein